MLRGQGKYDACGRGVFPDDRAGSGQNMDRKCPLLLHRLCGLQETLIVFNGVERFAKRRKDRSFGTQHETHTAQKQTGMNGRSHKRFRHALHQLMVSPEQELKYHGVLKSLVDP